MDRTDFYYRQRVTEAELDETLDKAELADWAIVSDILGHGIFGTPVVLPAAIPDLTVDVPALIGYDQSGRRLKISSITNVNCAVDEVAASTAVVTPGNEKWLTLFIEFDRNLLDPRTDGNGTPVYWEHDEFFKINVVQGAEAGSGLAIKPVARADQLILCDTMLIYGQTQITVLDASRREDFTLSKFLHGASHRELGADPVPNAIGGGSPDGGLMSGTDKVKLDTVTWTGPGISTLLGRIGRAWQPVNVNAPNASSIVGGVIDAAMSGKTAGGGSGANGVVTTAPENYIPMFDLNGDSMLDGTGNKVFGRLTEAAGTWTLSFYSNIASVETAFDFTSTPYAGLNFQWYSQEVFELDSFPWASPVFAIASDQVAGTIPDGSETLKGKVQFAPNNNIDALKAVQGNDSRLLPASSLSAMRKLASKPSMIFLPRDDGSLAFNTYRLHIFHGMAKGDSQVVAQPHEPGDFYFEFDPSHAQYTSSQMDIWFNSGASTPANKGLGGSDNTDVIQGLNTWYFCYIIGRELFDGVEYATVVSTRSPWEDGPLLDDVSGTSPFPFWNGGTAEGSGLQYKGGWKYWTFIGCVMNLSATDWELAQGRKYGNRTTWELAHTVLRSAATGATGWTQLSLVNAVPPTSLRAELCAWVTCEDGGNSIRVRPSITGVKRLREVPTPGIGGAGILGIQEHKLLAQCSTSTAGVDRGVVTGDVDTTAAQCVDYDQGASGGSVASVDGGIDVLSYVELDMDVNAAELSF